MSTRKYTILVLTNHPIEAHETILQKTFGRRPYKSVRANPQEIALEYDDASILIKRYTGNNPHHMRGLSVEEVWIDEYVWSNTLHSNQIELGNVFHSSVRIRNQQALKYLPHYAGRKAINFFSKWDY